MTRSSKAHPAARLPVPVEVAHQEEARAEAVRQEAVAVPLLEADHPEAEVEDLHPEVLRAEAPHPAAHPEVDQAVPHEEAVPAVPHRAKVGPKGRSAVPLDAD